MKIIKTLAAVFIIVSAVTNLYSGDKIRIILQPPPPGKLGVGDMWNLTLENTTKESMEIHVGGTASEEKDGLIIEGKTKKFTIKPGRTSYKYSDFPGAEIKYNNGKYKEIILRTGNAPEGNYTICVTAYNESGEIIGQENCITQQVQQLGSITLISPENGAEIDPKQPLIFIWTPLPKGGPYRLRIVELKGDQSPEVAMKSNDVVVAGSHSLSGGIYQVPQGEMSNFVPGKKYAWQVTSSDTKSEISTVVYLPKDIPQISLVSPANGEEIDPDTLPGLVFKWKECPRCPPMYTLRIVEIKGSQSPDEAFRTNQPIFEKELRTTSYQGDPVHGVDVKLGMKLAWRVTAGDVTSGIHTLIVKPWTNPTISMSKVLLELQQNGKTMYESRTDENGNFKFSGVSNGEYGLKISKEGFPPPDRFLLSMGPGGVILCCCPGPPCEEPLFIVVGDKESKRLRALYFENGEISAKLGPFPPEGPNKPHR